MAQTLFTLPTQQYPSGTTNIPPTGVTQGATLYEVTIDISQMLDPATSYTMSFDISYDGGQNWQFWNSAQHTGGPLSVGRDGKTQTTQRFGAGLEQPDNANRKFRGVVTVAGPITIGGTVQVS